MYIKQFASSQFAGLKNVSLDFNNGLNVIVGANEAGKSTIVNAIYSVLFANSTLKKSRSDDKEFLAQYMPHPSGDFIDGTVHFYIKDQEYLLHKKWGNKGSISLKKPDGSIITIENDIEGFMKTIFELGPRTYQNIVFARQSQLKEVLDKLREMETIESVSSLLRKAVMNLDGVSIEQLRMNIDEELEDLLKRWDYDNGRPQDSKIYKTGLGRVLSIYYHKEKVKQEMNRVFNIEQELHQISVELHNCENRNKIINMELKSLEPREEDIIKRIEIEPRVNALIKQSGDLKAISMKWPLFENDLKTQQEELNKLAKQKEQLINEENAYKSQREREALAKIVKTVDENNILIKGLNEKITNLPIVLEEEIIKLEALYNRITTAETAMKAGKLLAAINKKQEIDVWVTRDLDSEIELSENEIDANGYLKIRFGELAEIEVKTGEFNFSQIKADYENAKETFNEQLNKLGVKDLQEAKLNKSRMDAINRKIDSIKHITTAVLGEQSYEEIVEKLQQLEPTDSTRPIKIILEAKKDVDDTIQDKKVNIKVLQKDLEQWAYKYESKEKLLDNIIDLGIKLKGFEEQLGQLHPLPEGFVNAGQFRLHLKQLRDEQKRVGEQLREHWKNHDAKERELPEDSYEELKVQHEIACKEFDKKLSRAEKLAKIKAAFAETLEEMDSNSIQPLVDSFSRYLSIITLGNYKLGSINEHFDIDMIRQDDVRMPINLLSSGTYDSVALSLRFAMLEHIFAGENGFAVLDDCLVDLDPDRRGEAIRIIREYANENQVIFTTCSSETAQLLGGNIIIL